MDYNSVVLQSEHKDNSLKCINSIDQYIKFTLEDTSPDGSMPFLDTAITLEPYKTLSISVYKKPIPTDQYSQVQCHKTLQHYIIDVMFSAFYAIAKM